MFRLEIVLLIVLANSGLGCPGFFYFAFTCVQTSS
jgi:hypothetical protein